MPIEFIHSYKSTKLYVNVVVFVLHVISRTVIASNQVTVYLGNCMLVSPYCR